MAHSGESRFGENELLGPLIRFAAAPLAAVLAFELPLVLLTESKPIVVFFFIGLLELTCAAFIVGAWSSPRTGRAAFRIAAGVVSLFYLFFLVALLMNILAPTLNLLLHVKHEDWFVWIPSFVAVGFPCMWYAAFGRFSLNANCHSFKIQKRAGDCSG